MADVWVVDSNCFIHVGSMAPHGFLSDLKNILSSDDSALYVTPGVHGEIKTVRFQRWKGQPNLLDEFREILVTVAVDEAEVRALAKHIGEKASPQDVDLSLMILGSKLAPWRKSHLFEHSYGRLEATFNMLRKLHIPGNYFSKFQVRS